MTDQQCTAPLCTAPAVFTITGEDFDGTHFVEQTCASCGGYLIEAGRECGKPVDARPIERAA